MVIITLRFVIETKIWSSRGELLLTWKTSKVLKFRSNKLSLGDGKSIEVISIKPLVGLGTDWNGSKWV